MERRIVKTADGSTTIFLPEWDEHYHSKHGALQEAYHVFIKMGLEEIWAQERLDLINIMEMGFGTGLNAFITLLEAEKQASRINYMGIEAYPLSSEEVGALNYVGSFDDSRAAEFFRLLHEAPWEEYSRVTRNFNLIKRKQFFEEITLADSFDLIYFDAFGARVQPHLWTEDIFRRMFNALKTGGILVTYAAKGSVRRAMQSVGFSVERLSGPPGKREMLRARKQ